MNANALKVLIVDDDYGLASGLAEIFELEGMIPKIARSISEALLLAENSWDIAVVDGNLSRGVITGDDGRTVTEKIAALHPETKILGFSGENYQSETFWKQHGLFIQKPAGPNELMAKIEELLT